MLVKKNGDSTIEEHSPYCLRNIYNAYLNLSDKDAILS